VNKVKNCGGPLQRDGGSLLPHKDSELPALRGRPGDTVYLYRVIPAYIGFWLCGFKSHRQECWCLDRITRNRRASCTTTDTCGREWMIMNTNITAGVSGLLCMAS